MKLTGISIKPTIGVGDALQFSSVPENYYRATGRPLVDVSKPWFFDKNPYVVRDANPTKVFEMWNFGPRKYEWPVPRPEGSPRVYLCNAEIHAKAMGVEAKLIRPRLYQFEDFPYERREKILLHVDGKSHGDMPRHVIQHVLDKYKKTGKLFLIGQSKIDLGIPRIETPTLWHLAQVISEARMLIGMDSGPSWIAACYPDVVVKKLKNRQLQRGLRDWIPLEIDNVHSHWDDRCHQIFNPTDEAIGFTESYRKI